MAPPAEQPKPAAPVVLPPFDFSRLAHPSVADQLELTDEQRASVVQLINARAQALVGATPEKRVEVLGQYDEQLIALLNEGQRAKLLTMATTQKLRFNFRSQKWADVLDWFARQGGLALVMDQIPEGSFTYSDNREYSPTEAIDLLNSVLLTKGLTLLQRGRMLILVDLSKDLRSDLIPRIKPEEIPDRGKFEIVTVQFPMGRRPVDAVAKEIEPLLSPYGSCIALTQTGQLLVTETAGKLQTFSILIASIPEPPLPEQPKPKPDPPAPVLGVYPVTAIDPAAAVATLEVLFPRAEFKVDDVANQIMAHATPKEHEAIKAAVDQLQANRSPENMPRLEVYPLTGADATGLVKQLQAILPDLQATVDTTENRLLVFAKPKEQEQVKGMIDKLGSSAEMVGKQVVVYEPKHFDATALSTLIKQLMPRAEVTADAKLRRVVVNTTEGNQAMVKSLVEQLDKESALEDQPTVQLFTLAKPLDDSVMTTLTPLVPDAKLALSTDKRQLTVVARVVDQTVIKKLVDQWQQIAAERPEPVLKIFPLNKPLDATMQSTLASLVPTAKIVPSADTKKLIVIGQPADHEIVQKTLEQIAAPLDEAHKPSLEFYHVDGIPAAQLQALLQPQVVQATITVDAVQDRLIVWAPAAEHEAFAEVLAKLEKDPLAGSKPVLQFYPLSDETLSSNVLTVLTTVVPTAKVTWDAPSKRLTVIATPKDHQLVSETIEKIVKDAVPLEPQVLKPYALDATQKQWFKAVQADLILRFSGMRVIEDPQTGEIAVWARPEQHDELRKVIDAMATQPAGNDRPVLLAYPVAEGSAKAVFEMLKQVYPSVKLTLNEDAEQILAYAPLSVQAQIKMSISQMDVPESTHNKEVLRTYDAGDLNPTTLVTMVQSLLPKMKITPDAAARKILASGTADDHEVLEKALAQFRVTDPAMRPVVKIYPLKGQDPTSAAQIRSVLLQVVPTAVIGIDSRGGSLAIAAKEEDHVRIQETMDELVAVTDQSKLKFESYTLDKIKAPTAILALSVIAPSVRAAQGAVPEQIVVLGNDEDQERVRAALAKLEETGGADTTRELRVHRIHKTASTQAATVIATALPEAQVLGGQGTDQLLIWATPKNHDKLDEIIKQVEQELRLDVERELKTFELKNVDPTEARRVLDAALGGLEYVTTTVPGRLVVRADPKMFPEVEKVLEELNQAVATPDQVVRVHRYDPDELNVSTVYAALTTTDMLGLTIQLNPTTNSLIVRGPASRQDELAATLSQLALQLPAPDKPVAEVYRLERAEVSAATVVIRSLVPTAVIAPDLTNQTMAITATKKDHEKIKTLVAQLDSNEGGDLVTETYVLKKAYPSSIMVAVKPIVPRAVMSPDPYSKSLIVTATAEDHKKIKAIIDQADGLGQGELTTKAYPLEWVSPYAIMTALSPIVPNATLSPDAASKTLFVTANAGDHERIAAVLKQADQRGGGDLTTKAYPLKWANASTIYAALLSVVPDAKISPDPVNKMLIATASVKDHERIQAVLEQADRRGGAGEPVTKAYTLQVANPSTITAALTPVVPNATISPDPTNQLLIITASEEDHVKIQTVIDEADRREDGELVTEVYALKFANPYYLSLSIKPIAPRATMSPDPVNKTLVVTASAKEHAKIKPIIDQADSRGGQDLITTAYPLKWAYPSTVAAALTPVVPDAKVSTDPVNKMLIVTATADDHKRIVAVLEQADKRGGVGDLATKAYALQVANPSTITAALAPVVPNATISPDPTNQLLIVTASEEDHTKIQAVINEADRREDGELVTEVYALKFANPTYLSISIKPIAPRATVSPDPVNKTLVVTASAKEHAKIKSIIDQADSRGGENLVTTAYPLKWAYPSTVAAALTPVVPDAKVSTDPVNKMLIVTATPDDHKRIVAVLEQADKRGGVGDLATKAYALQVANPSTITAALAPVVPNATISPDPTNQLLIVTASEEDHVKIQAVIDEADRREDGELVTEVYALKFANPYYLSLSIKPIAPRATISPDIVNKTLVITASAKEHAKIKPIIDQADSRGGQDLITTAYTLKWASPYTVTTALTTVVPDAKISADPTNKMLIATATADDHKRIKTVLDQADKRGGGDLITKAFTLRTANPSTLLAALTPVVPDAKITADVTNQMIIVTASAEDHERIKPIVEEADQQSDGELITEVYKLKWANPVALSTSIKPIAPRATLSPDVYNKTLIVTATSLDQARIKPVVEQADRRGEGELSTKVYPFKQANPSTVATALTTLMPNATLSSDLTTNTLIVTATAEDHKQIEPLVQQLDVTDPKASILKPYTVTNADPRQVYQSLTQLYRNSSKVSVGYQQETGMILVFAPLVEQEEVARAVQDIDLATAGRPKATLETYPLEGLDGDAAMEAIRALLVNETPKIELQIDNTNNQILAIAEPKQHDMLRRALSQLVPEQREVEVFSLKRVDPFMADSAISTLFADLPFAAMPSVEADPNTQQLLVRATKSQLARISELLQKMGEGVGHDAERTQTNGGMLRILPLSGDVDKTLQQIERIWPQVRGNPIQVITPQKSRATEPSTGNKPTVTPPPSQQDPTIPNVKSDDASSPKKEPDKSSEQASESQSSDSEPTPQTAPGDKSRDDSQAILNPVPVQFASWQVPQNAVPQDATSQDATSQDAPAPAVSPSVTEASPPAAAPARPHELPSATDPSAIPQTQDLPPLVVIAGEGRITVACRDQAALDQFEELLKTLQRGRRVRIESGNYAIFLLQNADATQLAEVVQELFRRGGRGGGGGEGGYRPSFRRSANLTVVPDERMNALLVYGTVADRDAIEEILDVLDSVDIPDSLTTSKPRMIPVKNLPASTVLEVLKSVYKSQLSSASGRKPLSIPQGISFEVSSMMQLVNAAAEAPLLTLDIDPTTNSIVMRAPRQLGEEIEEFVGELDDQAKDGGKRNITLVPLKSMNTEQVEGALQYLMRGGRYRGR